VRIKAGNVHQVLSTAHISLSLDPGWVLGAGAAAPPFQFLCFCSGVLLQNFVFKCFAKVPRLSNINLTLIPTFLASERNQPQCLCMHMKCYMFISWNQCSSYRQDFSFIGFVTIANVAERNSVCFSPVAEVINFWIPSIMTLTLRLAFFLTFNSYITSMFLPC
jgi:hypothetical protein